METLIKANESSRPVPVEQIASFENYKDIIREGMKLIKIGCAQNEGMCNNCPFFKICEQTTMKNRIYDFAKWSPENWSIE